MQKQFSGTIFIFHAFDVGEDINLDKITTQKLAQRSAQTIAKYFKNYHVPLTVELPHPQAPTFCKNAQIHSFGAISLRYAIPFRGTLEELRSEINGMEQTYSEKSIHDAESIFQKIKSAIKHPRFFHLRTSYFVIQVNPQEEIRDIMAIKEQFGSTIASLLRFETEALSEYQRDEILADAFGYYRGDLIVIDTNAAFMYDDEYDEALSLFEFANIQHLELQYFDRILDKQLNLYYEQDIKNPSYKAYLPFFAANTNDPIAYLSRLKVDISVITERLENSIKLTGDAYYTELYSVLSNSLELPNWKESINKKLSIIRDITSVHQHKIEIIKDDIISLSIIVLIFLEFLMGLLNLLKN